MPQLGVVETWRLTVRWHSQATCPRTSARVELKRPAPVLAVRNGDRRLHEMAFGSAFLEAALDRRSPRVDADPRVPIGHRGWMDTRTPFRRARRCMSLAVLRLHHGRRSGDADRELAAVDGSDPPLRDAWIGIGEGIQRRCGAAGRQFYRPSSRCVCATGEDRARTRGERQTVGCRERRAMSRRFGSPETLGCGKVPIRESRARSLPRS